MTEGEKKGVSAASTNGKDAAPASLDAVTEAQELGVDDLDDVSAGKVDINLMQKALDAVQRNSFV